MSRWLPPLSSPAQCSLAASMLLPGALQQRSHNIARPIFNVHDYHNMSIQSESRQHGDASRMLHQPPFDHFSKQGIGRRDVAYPGLATHLYIAQTHLAIWCNDFQVAKHER